VRQLSSEPSGKMPGPSRLESFAEASDDPTIMPKRYTSEPSGKTPGPSRIETR